MAATNRDLRVEVAERRFREDLFFRLSVVPIVVPPLRDCGDDALLLAHHVLERQAQAAGRPVPVLDVAARRPSSPIGGPANAPSLQNCLERAAIRPTTA